MIASWLWQSISARSNSRNVQNFARVKCCSQSRDWHSTQHSAVQGLTPFHNIQFRVLLSTFAFIAEDLNCFSVCTCQVLTPSVLIARLINSHKHLLALRISEYLGMNQVSFLSVAACNSMLYFIANAHS